MTYLGDLFTKVIELPYVNNELSMFILLPDEIQDGTTGLEKVRNFSSVTSVEVFDFL